MTTQAIKKPPRILVGVFDKRADLWTAFDRLSSPQGVPQDSVGVISRGEHSKKDAGHRQYDNLLSVMVPLGRQAEIAKLLKRAGATHVVEPAELGLSYKQIPHPGMIEDKELKFPSDREYPRTISGPPLAPARVPIRHLDPVRRIFTFDEMELPYTPEEALAEASRCLKCPDEPCRAGCPAGNDIPGFIRALREQRFSEGVARLRRTTNFPAICGRVCDKARQCEGVCTLGKEGEPVAIGMLERFLADWERREGLRLKLAGTKSRATGKKVAIVGSGPSGLAAACDLAALGHQVTIYEAMPVPGGALAWGIPTFRLPDEVVQIEVEFLSKLGVELKVGVKVGVDVSLDDLLAQSAAVYIGAGAVVPQAMGAEGETLRGIYTSTEFLSRAKLSHTHVIPEYKSPVVGERLVVIGGGNTAMDVAQTALRLKTATGQDERDEHAPLDVAETAARLGFREVTVVYRRSEAEMPARGEEVRGAREEGTQFRYLTAPVRFIGDQDDRVVAMECIEMVLGKPDARGRREPVPQPGTEFILPVDTVVLALGYKPERMLSGANLDPTADRSGLITVDTETGRTNRPGVWAGGDIVSGANTVVRAMVAGKRSAVDIDRYLREQ